MQALRTWMKRYGIVYFYIAARWFCNVTYKEFCYELQTLRRRRLLRKRSVSVSFFNIWFF